MISSSIEHLHLPLDLGEMAFEEMGNVMTRCFTPIEHLENRGDLSESETGALRVSDESKPFHSTLVVVAISIR